MPDIRFLKERCVACGDCVEGCPQSGADVETPVLKIDESGEVAVVSIEGCIACFTCVENCRAAAIVISNSAASTRVQPCLYPTRPASRII